MAARTILANSISQVSENADEVLNLYKKIAEQNAIAAEKVKTFGIVDEFKHYASALYVMTMAYSPETKKKIVEGLHVLKQEYKENCEYRQARFISEMCECNLIK